MKLYAKELFQKSLIILLFALHSYSCQAEDASSELINGFVYLNDEDPSILVNLKYHGEENFMGAPLLGCRGSRAVITSEAASALKNVQEDLISHGYSLVVYDAYRPLKTLPAFKSWLQVKDTLLKEIYYPNFTKEEINEDGYLQEKRHHVRGSTVDVSIISIKDKLANSCTEQKRNYKGAKCIKYLNDNTVEMGTSYDTFDPLSAYSNSLVPDEAAFNRRLLKNKMQNHGFIQSEKFWWQFTLMREPYIDSVFDFDI